MELDFGVVELVARMAEWFKALDLSSSLFGGAGSNPAARKNTNCFFWVHAPKFKKKAMFLLIKKQK